MVSVFRSECCQNHGAYMRLDFMSLISVFKKSS